MVRVDGKEGAAKKRLVQENSKLFTSLCFFAAGTCADNFTAIFELIV
jgi:hypothetical protein